MPATSSQQARLVALASDAVARCDAGRRCAAAAASLGLVGAVHLYGAGKAAAAMAAAVASEVSVRAGFVVGKEPLPDFSAGPVALRLAAHPLPDRRSVAAGSDLCAELSSLCDDDVLLFVLSGGASSLIAAPLAPLTLSDVTRASEALLGGGVPIDELNVVRKHLTRASAGRLAQHCQARTHVLVISDVLGDDLSSIGSGPFAPDPSTFADALAIGRAAGVAGAALAHLQRGAAGELAETPKPGDGCFERVTHHLLASHETFMQAVMERAATEGFASIERLAPVSDDVRQVARRLTDAARTTSAALIVGSGEPTVVLPPSPGRGGRNQQLALLMARAIAGPRPACFLAMGSDGSDGPTDAAGAVVDQHSWARMQAVGDPDAAIERADAYPMLAAVDALIRTCATGTNLLDVHLLWRG